MTLAFGCAWLFFGACVSVHLVICRLTQGRSFIRNGYVVFAIGAIPAAILIWPRGLVFVLAFFLLSVILWNLYTTFLVNLTNSVSLRMMIEVDGSPGQSLSHEEICGLYSDDDSLESRLQGLAAGGLITLEGEQLALTGKGKLLAAILRTIRAIFGIDFFG